MVAPSPLTRGEREEAEDTKEGEDGGEAMLVDPPVPSLAREEEGEGGEEGGGGSTSVVPMVPPTRHVRRNGGRKKPGMDFVSIGGREGRREGGKEVVWGRREQGPCTPS
jgi:hypothetical protein